MYIRASETLGPPVEPISLPEAKSYLAVSTSEDDVLIANCIAAARLACEEAAHIAIVTKQFDMRLDAWPCDPIKLPWGVVRSIEFVKYAAAKPSGALGTTPWDSGAFGSDVIEITADPAQYMLRKGSHPCQLINVLVPEPVVQVDGIWIRYKAGFADSGAGIPYTLRFAILQMTAHLYRNREAVIVSETPKAAVALPLAAQATLDNYRMIWAA